MAYELKSEQFSGPIEKLLELIEAKKLEITQLSLAQVTADFLIYLQTLTDADDTQTNAEDFSVSPRLVRGSPHILADFLVVASRLLLIKSKALLPNLVLDEEEEQEIRDLEERLKFYQEFKAARNHLKNLWREKSLVFSREFLASSQLSFYPPKKINSGDLGAALGHLLQELQKFIYETKDFKLEVINLEEKMLEFLKRLEITQTFVFHKLTDSQSRAEIITCFLVILHLIKDQLINVNQDKHFSTITIEKI